MGFGRQKGRGSGEHRAWEVCSIWVRWAVAYTLSGARCAAAGGCTQRASPTQPPALAADAISRAAAGLVHSAPPTHLPALAAGALSCATVGLFSWVAASLASCARIMPEHSGCRHPGHSVAGTQTTVAACTVARPSRPL